MKKNKGKKPQDARQQPPAQPVAPSQRPSTAEQPSEGDKRPPKGAWKEKNKKPKAGNEGPSSSGQGVQPPQTAPVQQNPSIKQQQGHQPTRGPPQPQNKGQRTQGTPQTKRPIQHPRTESVTSQGSQGSDRSKQGSQKDDGSKNSQSKDFLAKMEQLSLVEASFPIRESVTKSKAIAVKREVIGTNYLTLDLKKLPDTIYHYDIKFDPDRPKKFMFPAFRILIATHLPNLVNKVAFDGACNFYSMEKLTNTQFPEIIVPSPDAGKEKKFKATIQPAAVVDMKIIKQYPNYNGNHLQQAIQALDIVLRSAFDRDGLIRHKRSVFAIPRNRMKMQDNYEMFIGLYQSFVMGERPYLNVDVSHKAFPSGADNLDEIFRLKNPHDGLKGLNLIYTSPITREKKTYKFNRICNSADREMFVDEQDNNKKKSVAQYFQEKGHRLRDPRAPCLHIGPASRNILIPIEYLSIPPGQALNGKAPESCTRDMVRIAATSTDVRKSKIIDLLKNINYKGVATIKQFGLVVGEDFIDVNSHILNPPLLQYRENIVQIRKPGQWDNGKFVEPHQCTNWGILCLDQRTQDHKIRSFGEGFVRMARDMGLQFADYDPRNVDKPNVRRLEKNVLDGIINDFKRDKIELLFVIIQPFGDQYQDVKKSAELRCGMLTQCIKSGTIDRMNPSTLTNILLKVNSKLGGSNQHIARSSVSIDKRPFMVIGADVTHPSPDQNNIPSVVGVAASYDKFAFRYNCQWRIQSPRDETIRDLDEIVEQHLRIFKQMHGKLPMHILYYRDGVSEGQFAEIKTIELTAIQKACQKMGGPESNIKITVIVVQKRHHTRFFPKQQNQWDRKNNNVTPGTVVDSEIVDSNNKWQFFMVSHQSIQGVAKPTKYCIIHDDANVSNFDLQTFTYNLCHLFTRCNRSVSYVAPTYYAHLVAARGRVYIHNERIDFKNLKHENDIRKVKPEVMEGRPMYFV